MALNTNIDLVGDIRPVVTPSATAAMSEAVRNGTISVLDIMDRVDERTRKKQELELVTAKQGIAEATDPALIQAKRNQQLAAGDQAQQTRELLPLARRATEEKLFGDINSGQIQRYGLKEKLAALNELGFAPSPDPQKGITPEFAAEVNKNFASLLRWQKDKADAKFELANIKQGEVDTGRGIFSGPTDILTGAPIEPGKAEALRTRAAKTLPEFLRDAPPGSVATSSSPIVAQAVQTAPLIQPTQQPVAQAAPVIQPAQAAVAQPVIIQPTGVPPGFTQIKTTPIVPGVAKRTDALQRELVDLDAITKRIADTRTLAVEGIVGPGQIGTVQKLHQLGAAFGLTDFIPFYESGGPTQKEIYTAQDRLNNAIADEIATYVQSWKGAISDKELIFFRQGRPSVESTPEVWNIYLDRWNAKNEEIKKIVTGELAPADPAAWAANPRSKIAVTPGAAPAAPASPAAPLPVTPSAAPVVQSLEDRNRLPAGTLYRLPDGTWRRKS